VTAMELSDWLILIAFLGVFGWIGNGDYEYRCNQAHIAYDAETCPLGDNP
jgi:hypothetical protein